MGLPFDAANQRLRGRAWGVGQAVPPWLPTQYLWDEKYFPAMANKYLQGVYQFDLHPPLGKFIIAIGIALLGNEPLGWRIMPLFGLALLPLAALLGWYCLKGGSAPCCWPPSSPPRRYS